MLKKSIGICVMFILGVLLCAGCGIKKSNSYMFIFSKVYLTGEYMGDKVNNKPEGKGEFTCTDEMSEVKCYTGEWKAGLPNGKGVLTYRDGTIVEGDFEEGELAGKIRTTYSDKSYSVTLYKDGKPYSKEKYYNSDGKLEKIEYYYEGETLEDIKSRAQMFSYYDLLAAPKAYKDSIVKIEGIIVDEYETSKRTYLEIRTKEELNYVVYYSDTVGRHFNQAYVTNTIEENDEVTVYGFVHSCVNSINIGEKEVLLEGTEPMLKAILVEKDAEEIPSKRTYVNLNKYMYYYIEDSINGKGTVFNVIIDYENKRTYYVVKSSDNKVYYLLKRYKAGEKLYEKGEVIDFTAKGKGYYKVYNGKEYEKFPLLYIRTIEGKKND